MGFFFGGEKAALLQKTQENLELSQKNMELVAGALNRLPEAQNHFGIQTSPETQIISEEAKRTAAYALNLCTVSVSQIIDYDDMYVLEQEYDSILNNLNLEEMPKDDALLRIFKQLLDVVSFFRMQKGDKRILEKEYQDKMKNAIWSAVPNVGMLVAGGSLITMAVSLASQVGIGYMNYRKVKAQIILDKEKNDWQLQRSAMEQFHGLRRELFDTAWRLAEKYNFPDAYRITEQQITRYNEILLDSDDLRRYERLAYMQDKFEAHPPFWYYLGKSANAVYQDNNYSSEVRERYKSCAVEHFKRFLGQTERNLFREDQILASCALEYFELLNQSGYSDQSYLEELIIKAIGAAGNSYDVLELCALAYLQLGKQKDAAKLLRVLVNEDYNKTINAQFLSSIYVSAYIHEPSPAVRAQYETLGTRVNAKFLFPLPPEQAAKICDLQTLQDAFMRDQRMLLRWQCASLLQELITRHTAQYNRCFPGPKAEEEYSNWFFSNDREATQIREEQILAVFESTETRGKYIDRLNFFADDIFKALNELYAAIQQFPFVDEMGFFNSVAEKIKLNRDALTQFQQHVSERTADSADGKVLISFRFELFTEFAFQTLVKDLIKHIASLSDMAAISFAESEIRRFCKNQQFSMPEWSISASTIDVNSIANRSTMFDLSLLGEDSEAYQTQMNKTNEMFNCLRDYVGENSLIVPGAKNMQFYQRGDPAFNDYMNRHSSDLGETRKYVLAVINDTTAADVDRLITTEGIQRYGRFLLLFKLLDEPTSYTTLQEEIYNERFSESSCALYTNKRISTTSLFGLIKKLADIEGEYMPKTAVSDKATMASRLSAQLREVNFSLPKQKAEARRGTELAQQCVAKKQCELRVYTPLKGNNENQFRVTGKINYAPLRVGDQFTLVCDDASTVRTVRVVQIGWGDRQSEEKEAGKTCTLLLEGDFFVGELANTTFVKC